MSINTDNDNRLHNLELLEIEEAIAHADKLHANEPDLCQITAMLVITEIVFIATDIAVEKEFMSYRGREIAIMVWWIVFVCVQIYHWWALSEIDKKTRDC